MGDMLHRAALVAAFVLVVAACGDASGDDAGDPPPEATVSTVLGAPADDPPGATTAAAGLPEGPSALRGSRTDPVFPPPLVDPGQIRSGGPPPDGIPPIEQPAFVSVAEADAYLLAAEPVVVVEIGGDARAYPVQVLIWHEIVNDVVGGVPVSVTYCPLCNSAATYERRVRGVETTFGTSGSLFASSLVMYDRATETLWTHFDGRAVVGLLAGEELQSIPSPLLSWSDFKAAYPDGQVLDRDRTGHGRRYGTNPYVGYDDPDTQPFLFAGDVDARARAKQRIVGVTIRDETVAYTLEAISGGTARATNDVVGGEPIVVLWKAGQVSALDTGSTAEGRDVGSVGVFSALLADGTALTFTASGDRFVDDQTGSEWTVTGEAVAGELAGSRLERIDHLDTFWFAWATFSPDTRLVEAEA